MEMIGGSSAPYLALTPCVTLFCILCLIRVETEELLDYEGRAGIIPIVRWNLRPVIFGVEESLGLCRRDLQNVSHTIGAKIITHTTLFQDASNADRSTLVCFPRKLLVKAKANVQRVHTEADRAGV